jgi:general stress protein 26
MRCQRTIFSFLLLLAVAVSSQSRQIGTATAPRTDAELIAAAREIIAAARYCSLITVDAAGRPQARTVDPFPPDEQLTIWLGTNAHSSKVKEIRRRPHVVLYYFDRDAQAYVSISGRARLVADPKLKMKWWKDEWQTFYPDRAKDYLLIEVRPERLEIVSVKHNIIGHDKGWTPPSVIFK